MCPESSATTWRDQILKYMSYGREIEEIREREKNRERQRKQM